MRFVSLDVETANADLASICAIGIATFDNGAVTSEWYSLIDPKDDFAPMNVAVHGIEAADVRGAPTFAEAASELSARIKGEVVASHTHFDRVAVSRASERWRTWLPDCRWLDTAKVARRIWADCAQSGYVST